MKARLKTGETVVLPKGCDCRNHNEPHWVYSWRMERDMTRRQIAPLVEKMSSIAASAVDGKVSFSAYIDYEQTKLAFAAYAGDMSRIYAGALREFEQRGIAELIEEESDQINELQAQRIQSALKAALPASPLITPYVNKESEIRMKAMEAL